MITQNSNHDDLKPKKARKMSDMAVLHGAMNSKFWGLIFFKPKVALWLVAGQFLKACPVILSYGLTSITRIKHGPMVGGGFTLTISFLGMALAYNSIYVWKAFTPFVALAIPFFPIWTGGDDLYRLAFVDIHSENLLIYAGVFTLASLVHTVMIYIGKGNSQVSKRGESLLYLLLVKLLPSRIRVSEFFVCCFLETSIPIGAGIYLWASGNDPWFGGFLILIAANEIMLQLVDKSHQVYIQTLLKS